jgi:hypothetical protein
MRRGATLLLVWGLSACENAPATQPEPPPPTTTTTTTTTTLTPASQGCGLPASRRDRCFYSISTFRPPHRPRHHAREETAGALRLHAGQRRAEVFVRDVPRYTELVVQALRDVGLCASSMARKWQ